jgi:amino-acid N-acetyltransferase
MKYGFACSDDLPAIRDLLRACHLPANDLEEHVEHFVVAKEADRLIGCVGLEIEGPLLRSLAVDPEFRNRGVAKELCDRLLAHAKEHGGKEIFLLTDSAAPFFVKTGFQRLDRNTAPSHIQQHKQLTELCPSSAVLMRKEI